MSGVATAVVAGAAIGGIASNKAAKTQAGAANKASKTDMAMFNQSRKDQMPWMDGGRKALNELGFLLGLDANGFNTGIGADATPAEKAAYAANIKKLKADPQFGSLNRQFGLSDLESDPIYQERLRVGLPEGQNNIMRMMSSRGGLESGATMKALSRFNQDYAGGEGANAFNRFQTNRSNILNPLQSLAGVGQTTAAQLGNQAIDTGRSIGNNIMGAGNARASGYVGGANAITGAIGTGINTWQQNKMIDRMNQPASYNNFLANNSGIMNQGVSSNDMLRSF